MAITAKDIINKLPIVDENILVESAFQPQLYVRAARYRVAKMRDRLEAVARYDYHTAKLAMELRNLRTPKGKKPFTENALKEIVQCDRKTRILQRKQNQTYVIEELAKQILRAFEMRREAIEIINGARKAEASNEARELNKSEQRARLRKEARKLHRRRVELDQD